MKGKKGGGRSGDSKKIAAFTLALALIVSMAMAFPAVAMAVNGAEGGETLNGENLGTASGMEGLKQAVAGYAVGSGDDLSASDVTSFINDYGMDVGILAGPDFGSEYVFNPDTTEYISATALSDSKFAIAYSDVSLYYGTALIGVVSGDNITFGSEYIFNSAYTICISATALSDSKFTVAYYDGGNSGYGTAVIGDVSGSTITFGSEYLFNSAASYHISATAISDSKFAVAYRDFGNSGHGTAVIGDVSGSTITFGSEYEFNSATTFDCSATALTGSKFAVAYRDWGNSDFGMAVIGDVSGSTITFGSEYVYNSAYADHISATALSDSRLAVAYRDNGNSDYGTAVIGDVSGSTITFGSEYVFNESGTYDISAIALLDTRFAVAYTDWGDSNYGTVIIGDVSGSTVTFGSEYTFNSATTYHNYSAALSDSKFAVVYSDWGNSEYGTAVIGGVKPTVQTDPATGISTSGATLNGDITDTGGENCDERGFSYHVQGEPFWLQWTESFGGPFGTGTFSHTLSGLFPGTTYEFRASAHNSAGWGYGEIIAFTTDAVPPTVQTDPATDITSSSANLHGEIIDVGGEDCEQRGFVYRVQGSAGTWKSWKESSGPYGTGPYNHILPNLYPDTTYEFRAMARNSAGWGYGGTLTFKTEVAAPWIKTQPATGITSSGSTLNGYIYEVGGEDCDCRGFEYREQGSGSWEDWQESSGPYGTGIYDHAISGLSPGTTYEFRARAHNSAGWGYGDTLTFATEGTSTPSASVFYFAEGYTGSGFQEYLCLGNPGETDATATITYMFPDGTSSQEQVPVPAGSRNTVNVNSSVGEGREVSASVESDMPIVAERPMYFSYQGTRSGGHDTVGATSTSDVWYFAEGYTGAGFDEWMCVLNPGGEPAGLTFRFQTQEEGEKTVEGLSVPACSRASFRANDLLGGAYQTSLTLESTQPVVAERSMYFSYSGSGGWGWTGGHCVMGVPDLATAYYFAEGTTRGGFEEWLTIQNPGGEGITVQATYQLGQGDPVPKTYDVGAASRRTLYVPTEVGTDEDVSVHLSSDSPFLAERPMYFSYSYTGLSAQGGHCVIGATSTGEDWFLAEGFTGDGFNQWLCLQNAGVEDATVQVTYCTQEAGALGTREVSVPAGSRRTIMVNDDAGCGYQLSCGLSSSQPIVVERPMYFVCGSCPGGHDVVGYMPWAQGSGPELGLSVLERNQGPRYRPRGQARNWDKTDD